ncbi:hypothetical protein LCM10_04400 [Rossellomorea aquimaris]|uniref:hypothetical protein n=1 Tax=Rossellomorea aquimaris TaxID=189382 RepID=UPI001CD20C36|nr:hypothetical protein [Rossellomorea aquimaris]MCA1054218.1 hypothetical protein [Rossellomorea aquimaris]
MDEIYIHALDAMMEKDEALNSEMAFIAIDMTNLDGIDEEQQKAILNYFNDEYKVAVMNATMEELKEKGYHDPATVALEGVL